MKKRILITLVATLVMVIVLMPVSLVLAIANPTDGPTIEQVDIYRHTLETDDMLILVQYYLNYAANPTETINEAYLGRLMNGGEITNVAPYSYYDKGYDHGVFSMYLTAAEASGLWEDPLIVEFNGNPTLSWPGDPPGTSTAVLIWHATITAEATETLLSIKVVSIANQLSDYWSVALTEAVAGGTVLSSYGEQYFTNAIPNLHTMCPNIFSGAVEAFVFVPETYDQFGRDTFLARLDGTMLGRSLQGLADWTTIPLTVVKGVIWLVIMAFPAYFIAIATKDLRIALFSVLVLIPLGTGVGMLSYTFTAVFALLCGVALAYAIFYQRSSG